MIISLQWLKEFTNVDLPIEKLTTLIGARLVEIEEVIRYGEKFNAATIARVVEVKPIKDSDHLNVVKLDDGGTVGGVERDEDGYVQVVCGAPNVRTGITVVWLPPGSTVPETYGDKEPFVLSARNLRGVMSNGMIASSRELGLSDDHEGILEIDIDVAPGAPLTSIYGLNDILLDIENKSLTHRPDTFGVIGFAREVAAIQGEQFTTPDWLREDKAKSVAISEDTLQRLQLTIAIDDSELSERYQGVVIGDVDGSKQSSLTMQTQLLRSGIRPISSIVDITNYLMLVAGQPLHAFDYDKLAAINDGKIDIHVRGGRENETLKLLDGRTIQLDKSDIVIANGETAVALAGAMGGSETEIDSNTKTIFLESATFNLYNLRSTQMRHGIFSEAITRFTKGQPAELTAPVLMKAVNMLQELMGATMLSDVCESYPNAYARQAIEVSVEKVNKTLGTSFLATDIERTMRNAEFDVSNASNILTFSAPYWRKDISIPEDIIEEIGRLNGFDGIIATLPERDFSAVLPSSFDTLRTSVRRALVRSGANEVLTYSFVHGDILKKVGQKTEDSYRIVNSISPSLQYYRQTLTPSLLSLVHGNIKQGYDTFSLFELNKTHPKQHGMTDEGVPSEADMIALTLASRRAHAGSAYYEARRILEFLGTSLGLELIFTPIEDSPNIPVTAPFEVKRSAYVTDKRTDTFIGIVGEYRQSVAKGFKLPSYSAGFEIGTNAVFDAVRKLSNTYKPVSRYPSIGRDVCFRVSVGTRYSSVSNAVETALSESHLDYDISPVDVYQSENDVSTKNITLRINLTAHDRTLTGDDASTAINTVIAEVVSQTQARVV